MDRAIESNYNIHYAIIVNGTRHERDYQQAGLDKQHAEEQFLLNFSVDDVEIKILKTDRV
jgi:hypothetical protein